MTQFPSSLILELVSHRHAWSEAAVGCELAGDTLCEFYFDGSFGVGSAKLHSQLLQCFHQGGKEKHEDWLSTILQR